ncbi:MAG TPA: hypothetical protein P5121_26470, partial [Caldilineaceae bacterium]|nr:hypothetical protein [Caldilineaceae bacterium]
VNDMLDYAQFHLERGRTKEGKQWLQAATVDAMQRPLAKAGAMASHVGISWLLNEINGIWTVSHGGATNGQIAQLLLVPSRAFALVILTNANRGRELTRDLSKWALVHLLDLATPEPLPQPMASEGLQPYTGYYQAQLSDVAVSAGEQGLLLQVIPKGGFPEKDSPPGPQPPIARAAFVAADELLLIDGPSRGARAEFLRADDGTLAWLRLGGRIHKRQP